MRVFKYRPPYRKDGKTNFPETQQRTGVYLIKENGTLVYVGYSSTNLYKTMYRHFQDWNDRSKQYRVSYQSKLKRNKYTVRVVYSTPLQAVQLELALLKKYKPRDNRYTFDEVDLLRSEEKTLDDYLYTPAQGMDAPF